MGQIVYSLVRNLYQISVGQKNGQAAIVSDVDTGFFAEFHGQYRYDVQIVYTKLDTICTPLYTICTKLYTICTMDKTCSKCGKRFSKPCLLKGHLNRKTPCASLASHDDLSEADRQKKHPCKYCGRRYTTQVSMYRHIRNSCRIANTTEGMEKLMDHTLSQQVAEQKQATNELRERVAELTALLKESMTSAGRATADRQPNGATTGQTTQMRIGQINTVINNVTIIPWDGGQRIIVSAAQIAAAFAENARLRAYAQLGDKGMADPEVAPPYVTELLVDLVRRGHEDPIARNVYLNPKRADQTLVHMSNGDWEVLPLQTATRMLFDGVAMTIHRVTLSDGERCQLPLDTQNALSVAGLLYGEEPDKYIHQARAPLSAHLSNVARMIAVQDRGQKLSG